MFLIGFTVTGAGLVGKLFGVSSSYSNTMPLLSFFAIFMILIGMWAGTSAAQRPLIEADTWKRALTAGISAGAGQRIVGGGDRFSFWRVDCQQN